MYKPRITNWLSINLALTLIAFLTFSPVAYLIQLAFSPGLATLSEIWSASLLPLLTETFLLALFSTVWAVCLGVPLAWLVIRTDLPWRKSLRWLAALPLAVPPYIGGLAYITLLGPAGLLNSMYYSVTGDPGKVVNVYGFWGGVFVLGIFTYPYVFLLSSSALDATNPAMEESARALGMSRTQVLLRVTLPLIRPSLLAGSFLVFLYALSDFGAVSILRVTTFTTEIYHQLITRFDISAAAGLSLILISATAATFLAQRWFLGRRRFVQITSGVKPAPPEPLGALKPLASIYVFTLITLSVFLPLGLLVYQIGSVELILGTIAAQWQFIINSLVTALEAATIAIGLALIVAYAVHRIGGLRSSLIYGLSLIGYAIPGTVLGLSLVALYHDYLPIVYATPGMVVIGYLVRFLPNAVQGVTASMGQVNRNLEDVARTLGRNGRDAFLEVTIPLIRPGLTSGWVLVFITSMKELAATLLLRPPGFDTIPVRIWIHATEGNYGLAAALSLTLICVTAVPLFLMTRKGKVETHPT